MEENKKDACCIGGKCACSNKWIKLIMVIVIGLLVFLLGVKVGARFNDSRFERGIYGQQESFRTCGGTDGGVCPMMRGANRGAGLRDGSGAGNGQGGIPETQLPKIEGDVPVATTTVNQ